MISKNSFCLSLYEEMKRKIFLIAICFCYFVFYMPIQALLIISQMEHSIRMGYEIEYFRAGCIRLFGLSAESSLGVIALAFILGLECFSYLYSRKKVDLYHSIPKTDRRRFLEKYCSNIVIFVCMYLVNALCTILILGVSGNLVLHWGSAVIAGMITQLVVFLCVYHVCIIAGLLVGNILVAGVAGLILLGYEFIVKYLVIWMGEGFFETYYSNFDFHLWTVPFSWITDCTAKISYDFMDTNVGFWQLNGLTVGLLIVKLLVYAVITFTLAILLYHIRPTENAGNSITFPKTKGIIKAFLIVPFTIAVSLLFYSESYESFVAALLGAFLGAVVAQVILEAIMEQDMKALFKRKRYWAIATALSFLILFGYQYDVIGFDTYVPAEKNIESLAINLGGTYINAFDVDEEDKICIRDASLAHEFGTFVMEETVNNSMIEEEAWKTGQDAGWLYTNITYKLKNGKEENRRVYFDMYKREDLIERILQSEGYKEALFALDVDVEAEMKEGSTIYYQNMIGGTFIGADFMEAYKKDVENMTSETLLYDMVVGEIQIENNKNYMCLEYPVYESFENTAAYLKARDMDFSYEEITEKILGSASYMVVEDSSKEDTVSRWSTEDVDEMREVLSHCFVDWYCKGYTRNKLGKDSLYVSIHNRDGYEYTVRLYKDYYDQIEPLLKQ